MAEWSKAHAWKVCVPHKGTKGSNPFLSAESLRKPEYIRLHILMIAYGILTRCVSPVMAIFGCMTTALYSYTASLTGTVISIL